MFCVRGVFFLLFMAFCLPAPVAFAAPEIYELSNARPEAPAVPDSPLIILPDGRRIDPFVYVPEGWVMRDDGSLLTDEGLIIRKNGTVESPFGTLPEGYTKRSDGTVVTPEGLVVAPKGSGPHKEAVRIRETHTQTNVLAEYPKGSRLDIDGSILLPDGTRILKDGTRVLKDGTRILKDGTRVLADGTRILKDGTRILKDGTRVDPSGTGVKKKQEGVLESVNAPVHVQAPRQGTGADDGPQLWSMLPLTQVGERGEPSASKPAPGGKVKEGKAGKEAKEGKTKEQKAEKGKDPASRGEKKGEKKDGNKETPKETPKKKPRIGEELHIPPEAAKTGSLEFLEGCWQGTRPEYFSKRIIYECFCFGKNGGVGKRRVIDPSQHRRCVGGTHARLSGNGVLHVTSQGAACSDGERWGQAEMTCRGKGQHTPCSWVFQDANGGRQSYEIPFVRVQSCGRR